MTDTLMSAMIYLSLGVIYLAAGGLALLAMGRKAAQPVAVVVERRERD